MFYLILILLTVFIFIIGSVYAHEYGHALFARMIGWKTHGMQWRWFGAGYKVEINQERPGDIWIITSGGLIATFLLFAIGLWLSLVFPVFAILAGLNFFIFVFNILPFPGLDGFYIAKAIIKHYRRPSEIHS
jgi:Zn-dependent protease